MFLIGFDPGGIKAFGWATLDVDDIGNVVSLRTGVVSSVPQAIAATALAGSADVRGIGIDAPLFWVQAGDRQVDASLRKRVVAAGGHSGTVSSVNSLQGACVVQGILAARRSAQEWPNALITEAHPKALLRLSVAASEFVAQYITSNVAEHERDAALAAFAAWASVSQFPGWINLLELEADPIFPGEKPVDYWFPEH